jgi:hypothetical protein
MYSFPMGPAGGEGNKTEVGALYIANMNFKSKLAEGIMPRSLVVGSLP